MAFQKHKMIHWVKGCVLFLFSLVLIPLLLGDHVKADTGFFHKDGKTYYYTEKGFLATGLVAANDKTYYFDETGAMGTGWQNTNGATYYFGIDGVMVTGSQILNGKSYYFGTDGAMTHGFLTLNENKYYFGEDGAMVTGDLSLENKVYHFREDGSMITGWYDRDGKKYYLDADGQPLKSYQTLDGKLYLFGDDGSMTVSSLINKNGDLSYFGKDGAAVTGWQTVNGSKYYFDSSYKAVSGKTVISGKTYFFNDNKTLIVDDIYENYDIDTNGVATPLPWPEPQLSGSVTGNERLDKSVRRVLARIIKDDMSEEEKLYAAYYWIYQNMNYKATTVNVSGGYTKSLINSLAGTAISTKKGSCEHYAALLYVFYQRIGSSPVMIQGDFLRKNTTDVWVDHVWLLAKCGGSYYHFDPLYAKYNRPSARDLFKKTDTDVAGGRRWDKSKYPAC